MREILFAPRSLNLRAVGDGGSGTAEGLAASAFQPAKREGRPLGRHGAANRKGVRRKDGHAMRMQSSYGVAGTRLRQGKINIRRFVQAAAVHV